MCKTELYSVAYTPPRTVQCYHSVGVIEYVTALYQLDVLIGIRLHLRNMQI